jgi:hypothetical protein
MVAFLLLDPMVSSLNLGITKNLKPNLLNGLKGQVVCALSWMIYSLHPEMVKMGIA